MELASQLSTEVGISAACQSLHVARATFYRRQQPPPAVITVKPKRRSVRALTEVERTETLAVLHSEELWIAHRQRCMRLCSIRAAIFVRRALCIACWLKRAKCASAVIN